MKALSLFDHLAKIRLTGASAVKDRVSKELRLKEDFLC
jgi:hypothetical protein